MKNACLICLTLFLAVFVSAQDVQVTITTKENRRLADGRIIYENYFKMESPDFFLLTADRAEYLPDSNLVIADGNVKIDYHASMGLVEVAAQHAVFDLSTQAGLFEDVSVQFGDDLFFRGERLEVLDRDRVLIIKGTMTSCNQPVNHWSVRIKTAQIKREGYASIRGATLRVLNVPVIYLPAMWLPAFQDRRSGMLVPETGSSDRNGLYLGIPFYWAPREDFDLTLTPYFFDDAGLRSDVEIRYAPSDEIHGTFQGNYIRDQVIERADQPPLESGEPIDPSRYRLHLQHAQRMAGGQLNIHVDEGSDFQVERDFLVDTERSRIRDYVQQAEFTRTFELFAVRLQMDQTRRILSDVNNISEVRFLPSLRLVQPQTHIGAGIFMTNRAYLDQLRFRDLGPQSISDDTWRFGLESEFSRATNVGAYIHTRYGTGFRGVSYQTDSTQDGERQGAYVFADVLGPRLLRKYYGKDREFAHLIDYGLTARYGTDDREPIFDDIFFDELDIRLDRQLSADVQGGWFVQSRVFVGSGGVVLPYLEIDLRQGWMSHSSQQPIKMTVRLGDRKGYTLNGLVEYEPEAGVFDTVTLYGNVKRGRFQGFMGYVKRDLNTEPQDSLLAASHLSFLNQKARVRVSFDYDFNISDFKSQELTLSYQGACVGGVMRYIEAPFSSDVSADSQWFQLGITLRNLGELGLRL